MKGIAYDVGQLSLSNQVLSLRSDEFLFQNHQLGALGLFILQLRYLVGEFCFIVSRRLDALLRVANSL